MTTMIDPAISDVASVEGIRDHFPALEREQDGVPVAYFDGPGGTQVPQVVVDATVNTSNAPPPAAEKTSPGPAKSSSSTPG